MQNPVLPPPLIALLTFALAACSPQADSDPPAGASEEALPQLRVAAVYDDREIQLRLHFATEQPSWYHQYLIFENGEWVRYGSGLDGPDEHGFYEDRISMLWDDGSVDGFDRLGGYVTVHPGMRGTRSAAPADAVRAHPHLGEGMGRSDVRKFIRESRLDEADPEEAWQQTRSAEELEQLRRDGVFLDLWQWRAHRSHPVGYADNGFVLDYRHSSAGRGMYTDNVDSSTGLPLWMYDPQKTGRHALRFEKLVRREYVQDDLYFLSEKHAAPFDPERSWEEGDALPHRFLREPEGSRGAIRATGDYRDGAWQIRLTRSLEAPDPLDSKAFEQGQTYHVAFSVHTGSTGGIHHLVTVPVTFALGGEAIISARHADGPLDDAEADWVVLDLFEATDPTTPH